jgi:hypothetical protein
MARRKAARFCPEQSEIAGCKAARAQRHLSAAHATLRFSAEVLPRLVTSSYSTF